MSAVMCEMTKLTGRKRVVATLFGPRIELEETVNSFDTNSGYADPVYTRWRKAKNSDCFAPIEMKGQADEA
jgi:hypothetical protein